MRPERFARALAAALGVLVGGAGPALAQDPPAAEEPRAAGTEVPVPKRSKFVQPEYPAEALARGLRGIVILALTIDTAGKVVNVDVVRSLPPFDEAAASAARQWEYEVTKVDGKPVPVRLTVPITFALKLPEIAREPGIPELRQGVTPPYPTNTPSSAPATVTADMTIDPGGQVVDAEIKSGESPWTEALLAALRTWRFSPTGGDRLLSFQVRADFVPPSGGAPRVALKLSGLREGATPAAAAHEPPEGTPGAAPASATSATPAPGTPAPGTPASGAPATAAPAPEPPATATNTSPPAADPAPGADTRPPSEPAPAPGNPAAETPPSVAPPAVPSSPASGAPPTMTPSAPSSSAPPPPTTGTPAPPPVEIIPPAPAPPTPILEQPSVSAVPDVLLGPGVPDLSKGRRPVAPPIARMNSVSGNVSVRFVVEASGASSVRDVEGPEMLKEAARQTVASWMFRRTTPERLPLVAVFSYIGDGATASVKVAE
jgi:TonB family protein